MRQIRQLALIREKMTLSTRVICLAISVGSKENNICYLVNVVDECFLLDEVKVEEVGFCASKSPGAV